MKRIACALFVLSAATALTAQTFTTLHTFDLTDGSFPASPLIQALDGDFYGTTAGEGYTGNYGTVFKITASGLLTTLHHFCKPDLPCMDGATPMAGLVQAADGDFYGTTYGGALGGGTVFKITPTGTLTTLYRFCSLSGCADGLFPTAGLIETGDGDFYGTTALGGAIEKGTVFKITPSGALTTLYSFCSVGSCYDGYGPNAALVQASNGNFYGSTTNGGYELGAGTVFEITPKGSLTTIYGFCTGGTACPTGSSPESALVQGLDGYLYGTAKAGNENCGGTGCGTVFKTTLGGALTALYSFCSQSGCMDGESPFAGLVEGTDGDFYGTTQEGGAAGYGTIFKITPSGTLTSLYSFCVQPGCPDGASPSAALVQGTDGNFYGTTAHGGSRTAGTVFSLSMGLGPFVKTQTTSGGVGAVVKILGTGLTGATRVTFNGVVAAFEVVSSSLIATTVPAGAASGTVQVVTPAGTVSSNVPFRVLP